jgi:nicotinamide-nucleotide amidase
MKAAVITVGDEILIGQVVNTNAAYLSRKLFSIGIPVGRMVTVPDDHAEIINEFESSFKNFDVVIVTGGLGPTHDDMTKTCIAEFFGMRLVLNQNVLENVKRMFRRRKIPMPQSNVEQAMVPEGAVVLHNKWGTAPGLLIEQGGKIFAAVPGVPFEMQKICEKHLFPHLMKTFKNTISGRVIIQKTIHTIGISESVLSEKIGDVNRITGTKNGTTIKLAFLPANYEIRLRITVEAPDENTAHRELKNAIRKLKDKAGKYIYSYNESPIEKVVGEILRKKKLTAAAAESCTGGLVASKITNIPGSSDYFLEGVVTYSNRSKTKLLGVKDSTLRKFGAVSRQTANEMAAGIRKKSGSDIGISTTGIAGPSGGTKNKPVGLVWIGYSDKNTTFAKDFIYTKDRLRNKEIMSKMALEVLRRKLLRITINN